MEVGRISFFEMNDFRRQLDEIRGTVGILIASKGAVSRFGLENWVLEREGTGWVWIDNPTPNPNQHTVFNALQACPNPICGPILAIGGGSAIDLAKALAALQKMNSPAEIITSIEQKNYLLTDRPAPEIIAVPTTAGTGSEVTAWATIWDAESGQKYSIDAPHLVPSKVWMVPELTLQLPARITLSTGLDALCQAVEAYWANRSDPLAKALSLQAVRILSNALPLAMENQNITQLRKEMCTGSLISGLAFSRTHTTACHSISYPLTALCGIEHGFAAAITLGVVAAINSRAVNCKEVLELFERFGGVQQWLDETCKSVQPLRLSSFGVEEEMLPLLAERSFTKGRMDNNPVELTPQDVLAILRQIY